MASPWQYNYPGESKPTVPTDQGYFVNLPNRPGRHYRADEHQFTAYLDDGVDKRHMWVHDITMNFQVAGAYAQSPGFRAWYPRNFVQPRIQIMGQTASEADYGSLCEFIRRTQLKALRSGNDWHDYREDLNTVLLHIPSGGIDSRHTHTGHSLHGHITNIARTAERFVNAPEFKFEFVVTTTYAGLYQTETVDPQAMLNKILKYMRPEAEQVRNQIRSGTTVDWATDPDNGLARGGTGSIPENKK